ncbi:MAG: hypothetical protein JXA82_11620 [Sedimentisphaerales bacterium]|nr:hypothetical protein [Sedimentisphaerales bacterium]
MEIESLSSVTTETLPWVFLSEPQSRRGQAGEVPDQDRFLGSLDEIPRLDDAFDEEKQKIGQAVKELQAGDLDTAENVRLAAQFLLKFGL